jgi:NTP pyrophosphatase (non-canonical NTP hydrolase)
MTMESLQRMVDDWIKSYGVRYFDPLTNMAILTEEVGEVARYIARIYGEQSFKTKTSDAEAALCLQEEIGDVLFVLTCIANQTGIDLTEAMKTSLEKKTNRDANRHNDNPKLNG